jgi:REP element-mobilizing transposase RayT
MNRFWLITSTTYGTWLPGDVRGFVSPVENDPGPRIRHNEPGAPCDADIPGLRQSARDLMRGKPIYLSGEQAAAVRDQFLETVRYRGWELHAASVMANHFHAVVESPAEIHSTQILGDLKSYASRTLNKRWSKPVSGTWWTEAGSRRPLPGQQAVTEAVLHVVTRQDRPLVVWYAPLYAEVVTAALSGGR